MNRGIMILLIVVALFLFVGMCNNSNQSDVAKLVVVRQIKFKTIMIQAIQV